MEQALQFVAVHDLERLALGIRVRREVELAEGGKDRHYRRVMQKYRICVCVCMSEGACVCEGVCV